MVGVKAGNHPLLTDFPGHNTSSPTVSTAFRPSGTRSQVPIAGYVGQEWLGHLLSSHPGAVSPLPHQCTSGLEAVVLWEVLISLSVDFIYTTVVVTQALQGWEEPHTAPGTS